MMLDRCIDVCVALAVGGGVQNAGDDGALSLNGNSDGYIGTMLYVSIFDALGPCTSMRATAGMSVQLKR